MEDRIKATGELATRNIVTVLMEEDEAEALTVGFHERERGIKTTIRIIVEGALISIVYQGRLNNHLVRNVNSWDRSNSLLDAVMR